MSSRRRRRSQPKSSGRRKGGRRRRGGARASLFSNPLARNGRVSYANMPRTMMKLVSGSVKLSTDAVGTLAFVKGIDIVTDVTNFSARVGNMWQEYRVLKALLQISLISTATGSARAWYNIQDSAAPTFPEAEEQGMLSFPLTNSGPRSNISFPFLSTQLTALEFAPISANNTIGYWKIFTNLANLGAPVSTAVATLRVYYWVELRGFTT